MILAAARATGREQRARPDPVSAKGAHQLEEADVVADDDAALFAVKLEGGHMGAGLVIVMLAHRGEEMGFVVFGDAHALTVKDVGGVVNLVVLNVGNGTGHDVDVQLTGQGGAHVLDSSTVLGRSAP